MEDRIKLLWDFRGPNAKQIAEHHVIHLKEFTASENLKNTICEIQIVSEMYCIAFLVVDKEHMIDLRERLKPHRGQLYKS